MTIGTSRDRVRRKEDLHQQHRGERHPVQHDREQRPDPHRCAGDHREPRQVGEEDPTDRPEEETREDRAPSKAAQTAAVGETLGDEKKAQRSDAERAGVLDERRKRRLPEKSMYETSFPVPSTKATAKSPTARPMRGVSSTRRRSTRGRSNRPIRRMVVPTTAAATPMTTAQRNSLRGRVSEGRDVRDGQGEGAVAGPAVQAHEDQRADPGGEQTRQHHDGQRRAAEPGTPPSAGRRRRCGEPSRVLIAAKRACRADHRRPPSRARLSG